MAPSDHSKPYRYLCVDDFIGTLVDARSLAAALELGIVDLLHRDGVTSFDALLKKSEITPLGLQLLIKLLRQNNVVIENRGGIRLTPAFRTALEYRDLLETKIDFAAAVLPDFHELFTDLLSAPERFMGRSRVFDMFRYDRSIEPSPGNIEATKRWVRFTTCLTRYEATACLEHYDFGAHRRILDVGGNSGEFALRICQQHPTTRATILDLPLVCEIGRKHVSAGGAADRIAFRPGDARRDGFPVGHDLVVFKSFLHDWNERDARGFLAKAFQALPAGGGVLIYERGPISGCEGPLPYHMIPTLLFLHFLRSPEVYRKHLNGLGFEAVEVRRIDLEMPFHIITARKPG